MTDSPIAQLRQQTWPVNRASGDYRKAARAAADADPRRVICGFCGSESPLLDGPSGRAWWTHHKCGTPGVVLQFPKGAK